MTQVTPPPLRHAALDEKFAPGPTVAFMTGIDALARLPVLQHELDLRAGLNTAGFISGYRGSPLGGLDQALWSANTTLEHHNVQFQPGINEELAATAVWGSQQLGIVSDSEFDGVFGMWYGKGPGVDRSMDAIKHANAFGTSQYGGVLAIAGDDHACKSSTLPHQSEHMFMGASVPVLAPSNVQEVLDFGIYGWAMSRFTGCWVALKAITDNMDSAMGVEIDQARYPIRLPPPQSLSPDGMNARWPDTPLDQEKRLNRYKIYAARLFASINGLNRIVIDTPKPMLGIITSGKAYLDVMEALSLLAIDASTASRLGIRVLKVGMPWPLDPEIVQVFTAGVSEVLVVEEKRSVIEDQLTSQLYNLAGAARPRIFGEFDDEGESLLPNSGELNPDQVANAIADRLTALGLAPPRRPCALSSAGLLTSDDTPTRTPHFCSGCPHNTSTKVPEGSVAMGGIGCHYMATWMPDRDTRTFSQMGGEGAAWIGQAAFSQRKHVFQNLGDGTYFHSGSLAIRAAVASRVNITYKILFNEAVAMTGGQGVDGELSLLNLIAQIRAEGVTRIAVVSAELQTKEIPDGIELVRRENYDALQRRFREHEGTTVIIYQQLCANEKRRRQKRKQLPSPATKIVIHPELCEGCGDCGTQSNCLSIKPLTTELGTKRAIDQHSCNTDLSCVDGFCPSFISVTTTSNLQVTANPETASPLFDPLPDPTQVDLTQPWTCLIAGVGGTGVLTVGALLAMAAHIEGKGFATMNQTGLAQKFGAVVSHLKVAARQADIHAVRVAERQSQLLIGCDLVVAANDKTLTKLHPMTCSSVLNTHESITSEFIQNPDFKISTDGLTQAVRSAVPDERLFAVDASDYATRLVGDAMGANLFLVGIAYQQGLLPLSGPALEKAIEVNGVAIEMNRQAFEWGRRYVHQRDRVDALVHDEEPARLIDVDDIVKDRMMRLVDYQSEDYAQAYVSQVRSLESEVSDALESTELFREVSTQLYRLMALKDEYEVARILTSSAKAGTVFGKASTARPTFYFAPPVLSKILSQNSQPRKFRFGAWILGPLALLARLKVLRGSFLDPFSHLRERQEEREDLQRYLDDLKLIAVSVDQHTIDIATELAGCVSMLRGYGHVRSRNRKKWLAVRADLRAMLTMITPTNHPPLIHTRS
jgi:indolepyruvate ferredoxin oxidoreductase